MASTRNQPWVITAAATMKASRNTPTPIAMITGQPSETPNSKNTSEHT